MRRTRLVTTVLFAVLFAGPFTVLSAAAPAEEPSENLLRWMERVVLDEEVLGQGDPGALTAFATLDLDGRGKSASLLRRAVKSEAAALPFSEFHQVHGLLTVTDENSVVPEEKTRNVAWRGEGEYLGLLTPVGDQVLLRAPFWLPEGWVDLVRRPGTIPETVDPLELRQVITFVLPPGMPHMALPEPAKGEGAGLGWLLTWTWNNQARRHLEARFEAVLQGGEIGPERVRGLAKELRRIYQALARGARYEK